jgi:hypothetical protein
LKFGASDGGGLRIDNFELEVGSDAAARKWTEKQQIKRQVRA